MNSRDDSAIISCLPCLSQGSVVERSRRESKLGSVCVREREAVGQEADVESEASVLLVPWTQDGHAVVSTCSTFSQRREMRRLKPGTREGKKAGGRGGTKR